MFWYIPFLTNINAQNQIFHSQNAFQNSVHSLNMHNFLLNIDITMSLLYKLLVKVQSCDVHAGFQHWYTIKQAKWPRLTCTQALKVFISVKGSPWLLFRGWRAVEQSGLCWALRRNGDWTLRAAATVSTGSTSLKTEPKTNIFPGQTQGGAFIMPLIP